MLDQTAHASGVYRMVYAYLLTNLKTSQRYVGITSQTPPIKRWKHHVSDANRNMYQTLLHEAIRQYGPEAFTFEIIGEAASYEELRDLEQRLIKQHDTMAPKGYNMTIGGQGTKGYKWCEADRKKLSETTKGRSMAHATAASNKVTKGKPLSPEHRAKIGAAHKGRKNGPHSEEHKAKIGASGRGQKRSAETCARIAQKARERWQKPEEHAKASAQAKARKRDDAGTFLPKETA